MEAVIADWVIEFDVAIHRTKCSFSAQTARPRYPYKGRSAT